MSPGPRSAGTDQDAALAADPAASASDLARIAAERPDLHPALAANPATYPDLLTWLATSPDQRVHAALAARGTAQPAVQNVAPAVPPRRPCGRRRRTPLLIGTAIVAVLALVVGGYWLGTRQSVRPGLAAHRPDQLALTDISSLGDSTRLTNASRTPVFAQLTATSRVAILHGDDGDALVIAAEDSNVPHMIVPLPVPAENCTGSADDVITCGGIEIQPARQIVRPVGSDDDRTAPPKSSATAPKQQSPSDGSSAHPADPQDGALARVDPGTSVGGVTLRKDGTLRVGDEQITLPEPLPTDAPIWAGTTPVPRTVAGMQVGTDHATVILHKHGMIALQGSTSLWEIRFSGNEAELNDVAHDARPILRDSVLIYATADGIRAIDVATGATRWQLPGSITVWEPRSDGIIVQTGGTLHFLRYGDTDSTADLTAAPHSTVAPEQITLAELENATVTVPAGCASFVVDGPGTDDRANAKPQDLAFRDGTYRSTANRPAYITLESVHTSVLDGKPVHLLRMQCFGGGSYGYDAFGLYSEDGKLLGALDPLGDDDEELPAMIYENRFEDVTFVGGTLQYTEPSVEVAKDMPCHGCAKSGSARATWLWNGSGFDLVDVAFTTSTGISRVPSAAQVTELTDVLAGDDAKAVAQRSGPGLEPILQDDDVRETLFVPGMRAGRCELMGGYRADAGDPGSYFIDDQMLELGTVTGTPGDPGDSICLVDYPTGSANPLTASDGATGRIALIVRADDVGRLHVHGIGKAFPSPY